MKLEKLYRKAIANWPKQIPASDLINTWNKVEEDVGQLDEWDGLCVWIIYQCLHKQADGSFNESNLLLPNQIPIDLFDYYLRENLGDKTWVNERLDYLAANGGNIRVHAI